jgi:hypothetical protein
MAGDVNLLFHCETIMGVFLSGLIFFDAILHRFDTRLIAFRKRFEGVSKGDLAFRIPKKFKKRAFLSYF